MASSQGEKKCLERHSVSVTGLPGLVRVPSEEATSGALDNGERFALIVAESMEVRCAPPISCAPVVNFEKIYLVSARRERGDSYTYAPVKELQRCGIVHPCSESGAMRAILQQIGRRNFHEGRTTQSSTDAVVLQRALKVRLLVVFHLGKLHHLVRGAVFQMLQRSKHLLEALHVVIDKDPTTRISAERLLPTTRKQCFQT